MNPLTYIKPIFFKHLGHFTLGALVLFATGLSAQEDEDDNIFDLSPFKIDESEDVGYYSSQTLAGGRLKSDLKDVATTVQVVTQEMLNDIGATGLDEVLVYTTNTDIVGSMSAYGGLGESDANGADGAISQGQARQNPADANRVRGLAAATRTTNYFETSIPFDRYNSSRIDINRGANSFLFGLGSPGGIINNSVQQAEFRDSVDINVQFSTEEFESNYSRRGSVNLNKVLIEDKLAVRIALMESEREFMQRPAYTDDSRQYVALKFKPFEDHHVVFNANYETGKISAVPVDRVAPSHSLDTFLDDPYGTVWGSVGNVTNAAGRRAIDIHGNLLINGADSTNNLGYLGTDINGASLSTALYDKFLKRNGWAVVYDGFVGPDGVAGRGIDTGWTNNHIFAGSPTFGDGLSGNRQGVLGRNIRITEINDPAFDGYSPSAFTDFEVFDARRHLVSGSIDSYANDFDRKIFSLEAVTDDGNFGIDISYGREEWTRDSFVATSNPLIDIDTNYSFPTGPSTLFGPTNPNFGRLYFFAQLANQTINVDNRETKRATAFAKIDFADKFDSGILKWLGAHTFTGLYDDHELNERHFLDTPSVFGNNAAFELRNEAVIFQRQWSGIFYMGDPVLQAFEDPGFQLSDFSTTGLPPNTTVEYPVGHQMPIAYLNHGDPAIGGRNAGANQGAEVAAESTFTNAFIPFRGTLTDTKTESKAFNMQSRFLDGLFITNLGWREDEVSIQRNSNPPFDPVTQIPDRDPSVFNLDNAALEVDTSNIFSYGLVFHTPSEWLPEGTSLSFHYGESENFVPNPGGFTLEGNPVPGASGDTEEVGLTISLMDNKLVARINKYKGNLINEQFTPLGRAFVLFGNRDVSVA